MYAHMIFTVKDVITKIVYSVIMDFNWLTNLHAENVSMPREGMEIASVNQGFILININV